MRSIFLATAMLCAAPGAEAMTITIPVGYSDYFFNLNGQTGLVFIADAPLMRDPTIPAYVQTGYDDWFRVDFFDSDDDVLMSVAYSNYDYYSDYVSSHGYGAGPHWLWNIPASAVTFEIENYLSLSGNLATFGFLRIMPLSDGPDVSPIPASVPILPSLPIFATGLIAMLWAHQRRRLMAPNKP